MKTFYLLLLVLGVTLFTGFLPQAFANNLEIEKTTVISNACVDSLEKIIKAQSETKAQCSQGDEEKIAGRGCCSWHGGVCGCSSSGRAVCCDGALSPSCGC